MLSAGVHTLPIHATLGDPWYRSCLPWCSVALLAGLDADDLSVECKLCVAMNV